MIIDRLMPLAAITAAAIGAADAPAQDASDFRLEALTDFVDDALGATITHAHIKAMMARLREMGVTRVSWAYYGDGHGGYLVPAGIDALWQNLADTYSGLGNPLKVAVEAAHANGIECYAYYKPYETGPAVALAEGSPEARAFGRVPQRGAWLTWFDPFVVKNPHLRIRHRPDETIADMSDVPICSIKLTKSDDSPTRVTVEHLQIWSSELNCRYQPLDIEFSVTEAVEPSPRDVRDINGTLLTRKGDRVRTLTLSGFELSDPCILVTTDFTDGPGDFGNAGADLLSAFDSEGNEIPGVFFTGAMIYMRERIDFRNWGVIFDCGYGRQRAVLDAPNAAGNAGAIGFTRGRNEYLPGALCETEPEVRAFWLSCIREMLDAGVDGIDFRVENHGTHTEFPEEYGFNQVILDECARRGQTDLSTIAAVRGEAYTEFLRQAKLLIGSRGKRMRINLNIDWFRPDRPANRALAYPANMDFDWRTWVDEGLLDEAIMRMFQFPFDALFDDAVAREMIERCRERGIPLTVNRYVKPTAPDEFTRTRADGRFAGFILYETASYLRFTPEGGCNRVNDNVAEVCKRMAEGD